MAVFDLLRLKLAASLAGADLGDGTHQIDLANTGPGATGPIGDASTIPIVTIDAKGRVTALSSVAAAGGGGGGGDLTRIADTTLGAAAASFDFTSIAGTYKQLLLVLFIRSARAANLLDSLVMRFNNDSSAIYYDQQTDAINTALSGAALVAQTSARAATLPAATATAGRYAVAHIWLPNYANGSYHKSWLVDSFASWGTTTSTQDRITDGGTYASVTAISRVTLLSSTGSNLDTGSRATLYGVN